MVTVDEETQAKEFLKRAEIRTMRKDLLKLRESDALKERDKIAKIKTLDEQIEEKRKADLVVPVRRKVDEKTAREEILQKNEGARADFLSGMQDDSAHDLEKRAHSLP